MAGRTDVRSQLSDAEIEGIFEECGIDAKQWKKTELPIADLVSKRKPNYRSMDLNSDVVTRYTSDYENGEDLGSLVYSDDFGTLSGWHRSHAAQFAGLEGLNGYVVSGITEEKATLFALRVNRRHGFALTSGEAIEAALDLHRKYKWPLVKASHFSGAPIERVKERVERDRVQQRMVNLYPPARKLPTTTLSHLDRLSDDEVATEAAKLVQKAGINSGDVPPLISEINKAPNKDKQLKVVENKSREYASVLTNDDEVDERDPLISDVVRLKSNVLRFSRKYKDRLDAMDDADREVVDTELKEIQTAVAEMRTWS